MVFENISFAKTMEIVFEKFAKYRSGFRNYLFGSNFMQ